MVCMQSAVKIGLGIQWKSSLVNACIPDWTSCWMSPFHPLGAKSSAALAPSIGIPMSAAIWNEQHSWWQEAKWDRGSIRIDSNLCGFALYQCLIKADFKHDVFLIRLWRCAICFRSPDFNNVVFSMLIGMQCLCRLLHWLSAALITSRYKLTICLLPAN